MLSSTVQTHSNGLCFFNQINSAKVSSNKTESNRFSQKIISRLSISRKFDNIRKTNTHFGQLLHQLLSCFFHKIVKFLLQLEKP